MKKLSPVLTALLLCVSLLPMCASAEFYAGNLTTVSGMEAMLPAFDSVLRATGYGETEYNPRDPEFFWNSLYLMAVNWNIGNPLATLDDSMPELILPRKCVQELATALFADYDDLLPVPESMSYSAIYDESLDAYRFPLSDAGDSFAEIAAVIGGDDGPMAVYVYMKGYGEENEIIRHMRFELIPNPYVSGIADPTYLYSIVSAQDVEAGE